VVALAGSTRAPDRPGARFASPTSWRSDFLATVPKRTADCLGCGSSNLRSRSLACRLFGTNETTSGASMHPGLKRRSKRHSLSFRAIDFVAGPPQQRTAQQRSALRSAKAAHARHPGAAAPAATDLETTPPVSA
jgi:hypothetical protein